MNLSQKLEQLQIVKVVLIANLGMSFNCKSFNVSDTIYWYRRKQPSTVGNVDRLGKPHGKKCFSLTSEPWRPTRIGLESRAFRRCVVLELSR